MTLSHIAIVATMAMTLATASAGNTVVTTIDGVVDSRELSKITFDGDHVILIFSDNTSRTEPMQLVSVSLTSEEQSAIDAILMDQSVATGIYNLKGQRVAENAGDLAPGVYIQNGQKFLVK